jgi:DNA-binding response OmpR family regulator
MHILILEDEPKVIKFLSAALKAEGHDIYKALNIEELKDYIYEGNPIDVAIFDRMIGPYDSLNFVKEFKSKYPNTAILILSAINSPEEKAKALDLGADDYIGKPYSLAELSARIRALKRRGQSKDKNHYTSLVVGDITLDLMSHFAYVLGKKIDLSAKEFQLLLTLMKNPGQVFSKYHLINIVWDNQLETESNVVESTVRNIRKKLLEARTKSKILSKRNVGYWIEG